MQRGDLQLYRYAFKHRFPMPEEVRIQLIKEAARMMVDSRDPKVRLGAMKVLIAADELNLRQEDVDERRAARMALEDAEKERDDERSDPPEGGTQGAGADPPAPDVEVPGSRDVPPVRE